MKEKDKKLLIITDGTASIPQIAADITAIIEEFSVYSVKTMPIGSFAGNDLLPCCAFFLGCEEPGTGSFAYADTFFKHINLVGRPCGLFSSNDKTLKYLSSLVHDSEASANKPFLAKGGAYDRDALRNWVQGILAAKT